MIQHHLQGQAPSPQEAHQAPDHEKIEGRMPDRRSVGRPEDQGQPFRQAKPEDRSQPDSLDENAGHFFQALVLLFLTNPSILHNPRSGPIP